jgi:uncharacterized protein
MLLYYVIHKKTANLLDNFIIIVIVMSISTIIGLIILGIAAGALSAIVGIGGGIVIVPVLVMAFGLSQHNAQGTTLAMLSFPVALVSAYNYHKQGLVDWKFALIICFGFVIGGYFGSKVAIELSPRVIKRIFACLMIVVAIKMFYDTRKVSA